MSQEEIEEAIKFWDLENDEYYNFNTLKNTYGLYCLICFFEHKKIKVTRLKGNKCETKIISPRCRFKFALVFSKR